MVEGESGTAPVRMEAKDDEITTSGEADGKIDKITALQDAIGKFESSNSMKSRQLCCALNSPPFFSLICRWVSFYPFLRCAEGALSLAMFEALRGLRDAVAPESGNLGGDSNSNQNNENTEPDLDEFWSLYRNGDPTTVALVRKVSPTPPSKREDYARIFAKIESLKDATLVKRLADTVLEKSADIDERVTKLPGMNRTQSQQMDYIQDLLKRNQEVAMKLEDTFKQAKESRSRIRSCVKENTCKALGIVEETD
eukprot:scaffold2149_cov187-Cylindrotheca_fusiformis.AAC.7